MSGRRHGILGGTFDPVHFAHLAVAELVRDVMDLDEVLFVPAGRTVHKAVEGVTAAEHRARMVALAIADNPAFALSRVEIDRPGPSYTVDTLAELAAAHPGSELVFIASADAVREMPSWREPRRILEQCTVALVPRLGHETPTREWLAATFPGQADRFVIVATPALGHSASDIRRRVAAGRSIRYLVPGAVEDYIREHGLYRTADD